MSRLLEIRDYATAVHTFEWKASWRTRTADLPTPRKVGAKIKSGTPDAQEALKRAVGRSRPIGCTGVTSALEDLIIAVETG